REQSLQLLLGLLQRPGELVTREELMSRLWPPGTFVDSDRGLNKAMKHLREALGDSADEPRFIETFPRRGYRLLVPVNHDDVPAKREQVPESLPRRSHTPFRITVLAAAVVIAGIVVFVGLRGSGNWRTTSPQPVPQITSLAVIPLENLSHDPEQE